VGGGLCSLIPSHLRSRRRGCRRPDGGSCAYRPCRTCRLRCSRYRCGLLTLAAALTDQWAA
jgi:hypothetical protein